jgi:TetR/AcrR family transcriptional regulator, fatty acid metabolism regulator protein
MKTARQLEIVEAALELIAEKGIQGFTIKNLSKKIGVTEPAIYRHFENKVEILIAILNTFKENTSKLFQNELNNDLRPIEKISHLFNKHFETFTTNPSLVSVIFSEEVFRNEPQLIEKIVEVIEKNGEILHEIISNGQQLGEIRKDIPANHLAIMTMGSLRLFVKHWQFADKQFSLQEAGQPLVNSIIKMIKQTA